MVNKRNLDIILKYFTVLTVNNDCSRVRQSCVFLKNVSLVGFNISYECKENLRIEQPKIARVHKLQLTPIQRKATEIYEYFILL